MMKLGTMRALTGTLNDAWESPIADQILSLWPHDPGTAKFFRASANFLFKFQKRGEDFYLRFNHATERSFDFIRAEIEFVNHLAARGITVARPVPSRTGHFVESVSTPLGIFHAVVWRGLPGRQFEIEDLTPEIFSQWGKALGQIHNAAQQYRLEGRPTWRVQLENALQELPETEELALTAGRQLLQRLAQLPVTDSNFGLIHFDFELDNILWNGAEAGILDFDNCAYYWFAADVAFALRDLFDDNPKKVDLHNKSFQSFIKGYRLVREIPQEELEQIPMFFRLHNLITYARLKRTLSTDEAADDPKWLKDLRKKLCLKTQFYQCSFSSSSELA